MVPHWDKVHSSVGGGRGGDMLMMKESQCRVLCHVHQPIFHRICRLIEHTMMWERHLGRAMCQQQSNQPFTGQKCQYGETK